MKAKVKLTSPCSGLNLVLICNLVNVYADHYCFSFSALSNFQRRKIESYFGKLNAYYTDVDIIKIL